MFLKIKKTCNGFAVNRVSRSSVIHHTSSSSRSDSVSLPTASTSVSPDRRNVLQRENYSKWSGTGKTAAVDRKPKLLQWEVSNSGQASEVSNTDICLTGGLGSHLHGYEHWGKGSVEEKKLHINILELLTVRNAILVFTKEKTINATISRLTTQLPSRTFWKWEVRQTRNLQI